MGLPIESRKDFVTGASGYVGGRLVRRLVDENFDVRILVRDCKRVLGQPWTPSVEIIKGSAELASTSDPLMELRAGIIIGSGSASFKMLPHLKHRLPIMTTPKWVMNRTHPIAIRDVLYYLKNTAVLPEPIGRTFDIGGPKVLTYTDIMQKFAKLSGLKKGLIIKISVLTPWFSNLWIGLRRGRSGSTYLRVGDSLDFWRVAEHEPEATFRPRGLGGQLYWYALSPFYLFVFPMMLRNILKKVANDA